MPSFYSCGTRKCGILRIRFTQEGPMTPNPAVEVLIVEDDLSIQRLLTAVMVRNGLTPVVAPDGKAALALLATDDFDAIVLDLLLPEINGFDVLRHLAISKPAMLEKTIVLTAASERTYRNSPHIRNTRALFRKPFDLGKLQEEILSCCGGEAAH